MHNCPPDGDGDLHQPLLPGFERSEAFVPGELNVGTYNQLRRQNVANNYNEVNPHHIPQDAYMHHVTAGNYDYGTSGGRGIAINVQVDRHALTTTFNNPPDYTLTPLQTLTRDINDLRRIYKDAGLYNDDVEQALQEVIRLNTNKYPGLFDK